MVMDAYMELINVPNSMLNSGNKTLKLVLLKLVPKMLHKKKFELRMENVFE